MSSLHQAWEKIPLDGDIVYLTAQEIKALSFQEPRLMMKWDHSSHLPPVLKATGRFILPLKNGLYAIIKGDGYHTPEPCPPCEPFLFRLPFELETSQPGLSEMQHLDLAFNAGLISAFTNEPVLYPTLRGRKYSPSFTFQVGDHHLEARGVQIEIDQGYEGPDSIIIIEAKIGECLDFHLRQLYYPYRTWLHLSNKKVRTIFFTYEPSEKIYRLREYAFSPPDHYQQPTLVRAAAYHLVPAPAPAPLCSRSRPTVPLPQADKLPRLAVIPVLVALGYTTPSSLAERLKFAERQGRYYLDAACSLGFLSRNPYRLSPQGQVYVASQTREREQLLAKAVLSVPPLDDFITNLLLSPNGSLSKADLLSLIKQETTFLESTSARRVQTLWAWLTTLSRQGAAFRIQGDRITLGAPLNRLPAAEQLELFLSSP